MSERILVVNDDPIALRLTQSVLRDAGYDVSAHLNAVEALSALYAGVHPGLIVADLHMPGIDGWKLCRLLRGPDFAEFNKTPILVVSATFTGVDVEAVTTDLGANAFLPAPFHPDTLLTYVHELLNGAYPVRPLKALVVDDDVDLSATVAKIFERHGYAVDTAHSAAEAVAKGEAGDYDVFLLDYHLPDGDGGRLMTQLRRPDDAAVALVMTGDDSPDLAVRLLEAGADGYVRKPFDPRYLQDLAEKARRERSLLRVEALLERRTGELKESDARMRALFKAIPDWIVVVNWEGQIIQANESAHRAYGGAGLIGQPVQSFLVSGSSRKVVDAISQIWSESSGSFEAELVASEGSAHVEVAAEVTEMEGEPVLLLVARDVTSRKRAEESRRRLETQVQHTQRMESLGVLAGGIAHDFNNLLVGILGNASLALMDTPDGKAAECLNQIELAARRAAELTGQVLTFAGRAQPTAEALDVGGLVQEMTSLLDPAISKRAELTYDIDSRTPVIEGDSSQIRQVVMNLIMNASDALGGEPGEIKLSVRPIAEADDFDTSRFIGELPSKGDFVMISVSDTGCGMDSSTRARIFEPFFTTKFTGRGLGLAATLGIVHAHSGVIRVESEVGNGTTVSVLFPAGEPPEVVRVPMLPAPGVPALLEKRPDPVKPISGPSLHVLVADDEPAVLRLATMVLQRQGMRVTQAADGREALTAFESTEKPFDLVLADMTMPGLDGIELIRSLRKLGSDIPVLLSSGYDRRSLENQLEEIGGRNAVLSKPYRPADLVREAAALIRLPELAPA